jgi:hypothetical protein
MTKFGRSLNNEHKLNVVETGTQEVLGVIFLGDFEGDFGAQVPTT